MMHRFRVKFVMPLLALLTVSAQAFTLPADSRQLVLGLADRWSSSNLTLQLFEQQAGRWVAVSDPIPARGGRDGLAWGRGLHPLTMTGEIKQEGDWKTPCGVFTIGGAYGYAADRDVHRRANLPYHRIVAGDLWVEDARSPKYNQFIALGRPADSDWERRQQMRLNDPAHSLKLFIAHNAPPTVSAGAGSAIFFHIWRAGGEPPTAGCTALARDRLTQLIAWIDPAQKPLYVLLPKDVYAKVRAEWRLP
ncbi:MAG: L,D-transpeptidase family protein [Verrucomicrobiales bacterium]|jgi:L,D-peptidoglycan transpeptidase YkuD (ErfK/YbiS/YcfS/YnhG family)|nr:L,D-transpeptidase family protein [Verrucomicrobiales bacterium]